MPEIVTDCPYCKEEINARATVCKHCGKAVTPIPEEKIQASLIKHAQSLATTQTQPANPKQSKVEIGMSYLLWCMCFIGLAGIHRFYHGKKGTGLLWLFTWGLFGVGQFIDLLTMSSKVNEINQHVAYQDNIHVLESNHQAQLETLKAMENTSMTNAYDEIRRLGELHKEGLLSDEEFQTKKQELLNRL